MKTRESQHDSHMVPDHSHHELESLVTLLVHSTKAVTAVVGDIAASHNFTLDEWMVLDAIFHHNGVSMTQIALASGCQGATLTRAVDKLVSASLVYREASASDRRKVVVFIADQGRDIHAEVRRSLREIEESAHNTLATAGLTPGDFAELMRALAHPDTPAPGEDE